ncbi:MAG: hypothetical protein KGJ02_06020 [Verrucomicrobiota bacterium]|nr:hypothetical protein [Verrucomicrobiota bacterium]
MKSAVCLVALAAIFGSCDSIPGWMASSSSKNVVDYRVRGDRFIIVAAEKDGISAKEARRNARKRAKELTLKNGYRYFVVESEEETTLAKESWRVQGMDSFPNSRKDCKDCPEKKVFAIRLTIQCHSEKPDCFSFDAWDSGDAEEVCQVETIAEAEAPAAVE